jgi:cell wall-associated NlpC family hydrolase
VHKILAMVAIITTSTLTTSASAAQAVVSHHLIDAATSPSVASPFYLRAPHANTLAVRAAELQRHYRVRLGDTLSRISQRAYGTAADWPLIWAANGRHNPNFLRAGARLAIPARRSASPRLQHAANAAAGAYQAPAGAPAAASPVAATAPVAAGPHTLTGAAATAFGACVREHENGDSYAWGTGDGGGAYQFEPGTWAIYEPAGDWGSAGPAEQDAAFNAAVASGNAAAWDADGCPQAFGLASVSAQLMTFIRHHHHRARHHSHAGWLRWVERKALAYARTKRGHGYCWGGTGPGCYDCSGLVMSAFAHVGFHLPRTAAEIQASSRLRQVKRPKPGDIILYGWPAYHAGIYAGHGRVFDALNSGTPVGSQPDTWPGTPIFYQLV